MRAAKGVSQYAHRAAGFGARNRDIDLFVVEALFTTGTNVNFDPAVLEKMLRKAAEFYEREIRNIVDSLASIIEPFLIICLGGIVGAILIALYYPVFMIGRLISGH